MIETKPTERIQAMRQATGSDPNPSHIGQHEADGGVSLAALPQLRNDIHAFIAELRLSEGHPLLNWWHAFDSDSGKTLEVSSWHLTHKASLLFELYGAVNVIKRRKHFKRVEDDLRNPDQFLSAVYEAVVAATYVNHGYMVEIQKEREGQRTCDFRLHMPAGHVNVEAKRLFNLSADENRYWGQIADTILSRMQKERRSWFVRVAARRRLSFKEQDLVMHAITRMARNNEPSRCSLMDGIIHVQ